MYKMAKSPIIDYLIDEGYYFKSDLNDHLNYREILLYALQKDDKKLLELIHYPDVTLSEHIDYNKMVSDFVELYGYRRTYSIFKSHNLLSWNKCEYILSAILLSGENLKSHKRIIKNLT